MASELERRVRNNETRLEINDTAALIEVWREGFNNKDSSQPVEIFLGYMPEHSKEEWEATVAKLTATSFPIGVQACHVWKHTTKDKRRVTLWSANGRALTGVSTTCWPMPGDVGVRGKATSGTLRRKLARGQGQGAAPKLLAARRCRGRTTPALTADDGKPGETSESDSDSSSTSSGAGDGKPDETSESDSSSDSESSGTGDETPNDLCFADKTSTIPLLHKEYKECKCSWWHPKHAPEITNPERRLKQLQRRAAMPPRLPTENVQRHMAGMAVRDEHYEKAKQARVERAKRQRVAASAWRGSARLNKLCRQPSDGEE